METPIARTHGLLIAVVLAVACGPAAPPDPDAELRALVAAAEQAAEAREAGPLQGWIADDYADEQGRDAQTLRTLVGMRLLRHGDVYLLTRIDDLRIEEPGLARVGLFVAMAGNDIQSPDELLPTTASLYRFDFTLRKPAAQLEDGDFEDWRVVQADFRRARIDDFR